MGSSAATASALAKMISSTEKIATMGRADCRISRDPYAPQSHEDVLNVTIRGLVSLKVPKNSRLHFQ
jgi:hypothetical protein